MPINPAGALTQYRTLINLNESNIATNTADIVTNTADILTNTNDIATLDTQLSGLAVNEIEVFRAVSNVTQEPAGLDTPLQITFGAAQANAFFSLAANGALTVLQAGNYSLVLRLVFGRTGVPGVANLYARALVNGVQNVGSIHAQLDNFNVSTSSLFVISGTFPASTIFTAQLLRASINGGIDAGGLFAQPSPLAGWQPSASCSIVITRREVVLGS